MQRTRIHKYTQEYIRENDISLAVSVL